MKQGWEIKKLGEVCSINYGTRVVQKKDGGTIYPVYGGGGATFKMDRYNREDCLIVSRFAMSNQCVRYVSGKFFLNDSGLTIESYEAELSQSFLDKHIIALNDVIYSLGKVVAQKNLDIKELKLLDIKYPKSREEQERIVAELDCLSGVIEKKREQLKELDALAESIFYTMFGDPITNEKGWNEILLKNAAVLKAGKAIKANELSEIPKDGLYPCYGGNGVRGYINKKSHNGLFPIIGRQGALCGNVVFAQGEFYATEHAVVCNNIIDSINPMWMYYTLRFNNLNRFAQGVAQPGISVNIINEMPLIYPPLTLQQEFADKIEAIEKQKELIKQSITETEELFNSRMDYYFN